MAKRMGIEGKVFVQFVVDKEGKLSKVKVIKGIGAGCEDEAVRVIQYSPKWQPGKQRGRVVKVRIVVPLTFMFRLTNKILIF
jgi:protein TonB